MVGNPSLLVMRGFVLLAASSLEVSKAYHDGRDGRLSQGAHSSRSPLLLSQLELSQRSLSWSQAASTEFGPASPANTAIMLRIAPPVEGRHQGFIYLDAHERIHQEPLQAYFDSAGHSIFELPCLDLTSFLRTHFLEERDVTFVTNHPGYILCSGHCILQQHDYLADIAPCLSWLPAAPASSSPTRVSTHSHATRVVRPMQPHTHYHRPDPDGFDSRSVSTRLPPLRYAHGGPTSFVNFSPLMTSFNASIYGGSRDLSTYGGPRPHTRPTMGGTSTYGGALVMSSVAGSLLSTSSNSLESSPPAFVNHSPAPPMQSAISVAARTTHPLTLDLSVPLKVEQAPPQSIKDKPSDLGIKTIVDKETWIDAKKVIEACLRRPLYWPGPSKQLITTAENAAASGWWEEVVAFFCKPPVSNLFVEMPEFEGKGFRMQAYIDSHFNPSGVVDLLSHIFNLIDIRQKENEPVVSLKARFSRLFSSLKMGGITTNLALQFGFMLRAHLSCYQAVAQEFCLGRHSLTDAILQTVVEQCVTFDKDPWLGPVGKDGKVPKKPLHQCSWHNHG
jgi:hypothetical protein